MQEVFAQMNNFTLTMKDKIGNYYSGYCNNFDEVENSISIFSRETGLSFTKYGRKTYGMGEFGSRGSKQIVVTELNLLHSY